MITVRNEVAKVVFLHLSVILFTGGGGLPQCMLVYTTPWDHAPTPGTMHTHTPWDHAPPEPCTHPPGPCTPQDHAPPRTMRTMHPLGPCILWDHAPLSRDGYCYRWYASYWNAFLFDLILLCITLYYLT